MKINFEKFPKLTEAKEYIKKLEDIEWPLFSDFESSDDFLKVIEKIILNDFDKIPEIITRYKPNEFQLPIFRARELNSFSNINQFSEHSYPPINLTGFNKCNYPNKPVFYSFNSPLTALKEIIRDGNSNERKFCLSKWEIIDSDQEFISQNFIHGEFNNQNEFNNLKEKEFYELDTLFKDKLNSDQKAGMTELIKFLHNTFINDKNYALSSTLAHRTLNAKHRIATDIIIYPSAQTNYKGINMAIHPNFVDNMMRVQRFYIVQLKNYDIETGKFNVTFLKYADIIKNRINWKDILTCAGR